MYPLKKPFVIDYTQFSVVVVCQIDLCQWRELTYSRTSALVAIANHERAAHGGTAAAGAAVRKSRQRDRFRESHHSS